MANKVFVEGQWKDQDEIQKNSAADEIHSNTLTRLITAAPLAVGAGVGVRNLFNAKLNIFTKTDQFNKNGPSLTKFLNQIKTPSFENNAALIKNVLDRRGALDPKLVQTAWGLATKYGDPTDMFHHTLDPNDPLASIEYFAQHNKSLQANKVIREFSRQMRVLEKHVAVTGSVPEIRVAQPTTVTMKSVGFSNLAQRPGLVGELQKIQSQLPSGINMEMKMAMPKPNQGGGMLMVTFKGGKFGSGATLELPIASSKNLGIIYSGVSQQTQRAVGQYALVDPTTFKITSTLNHEEYAARRFREQVLTQIMGDDRLSQRATRQIVNNFNRQMIEPTQVLPNLTPGLIPSHDASVTLASNRINLVFENSLERLNETGVGSVIRNPDQPFRVFASTSPNQIASGTVSRINGSEFYVGGYATSRRPMQAHGRSIGPTVAANQARLGNPLYDKYSWTHTPQLEAILPFSSRPELMARTVYISESAPALADTTIIDKALGGQAGGAGLISNRLKAELEYEQPLSKNLASITSKVEEGIKNKNLHELQFTEGEILGWEQGGTPVPYNKNWQLDRAAAKAEGLWNITGTETIRDEQYMKMFGGAKFVGKVSDANSIEQMVTKGTGVQGLGDIGVVVGMDDLRKNRSLHNMQMFTALQEFISQRPTGFYTNRKNWSAAVVAALNSATNPDQAISAAWKIARQQELTPWEMGRVFGAVPTVLGHDKWEGMFSDLSSAERTEINKGVAWGVGSYYYGGKANAGGIGSVEPRFFEMLRGKQYGTLGPAMAQDITERMMLAHPELIHEQSTLMSAMKSLDFGVKPMDGVSNYHIGELRPSDIDSIIERGGIVNLDKTIGNMNNIYIPGKERSASMRGYTTPKGIQVTSELSDAYRDLLETAQSVHGGASRSFGEVADAKLTARLGEAISATVTGDGHGLARGAVAGSRYLTAVPGTAAQTGSLFTMGVNKHDVLDMFTEMEETYAGNADELASLEARKAAFLRGEEIAAVGLRHPLIGPYSAQPLKMRIAKGLTSGNVIVPTRTEILSQGGKEVARVAMSAFAGMAGDYDIDALGLILSSSKIEKDIFGQYSLDNPYQQEYKEYAIRQQLLKAKAPQAIGLNPLELEAAAGEKLGTAKSQVGPLSEPLRELRTKVIESGNLEGRRLTNALSLLEALEQVPISGKHIPDTEITRFKAEIQNIAELARQGKGVGLANIAEKIFSGSEKARKILTEDMEFDLSNGEKLKVHGMGITQVASDITQSAVRHSDLELRGDAGARRVLKGSGTLTPPMRPDLLQYDGGPLSAFKIAMQGGTGQTIARKTSAVMNEIRAAGGEILEHVGKPLALGFGASLALSAVLSSPKSNLEPGSNAPPPPGQRVSSPNADSVAPETMFPDREVEGEPTTSPPIPPKTVRLSDQRGSYKIRVSGRTRPGTNLGDVSGQINGNLEGTTTTTVNVRDNRKSLSAQYLDSIMHR